MKEKKVVLKEKEESGETSIILPVTALKCVEPTTEEILELAEGDLVPIVQASDSAHLKVIEATALLKDVSDTINAATKAVETAANEAKQAAEKAQEAAGEAASSCKNKPFTLSTESWSQLDTPKGACKYAADITVDGVTAADTADVIFSVDCFNTLATASVSTGGETGEDKVTVYAVTAPTAALTGSIIIYKGGV